MNYIELNKASVKHKFPIPLIEDLFDELYGASIFPNWISDQVTTKCE